MDPEVTEERSLLMSSHTMLEAIALSCPSGRMSKRARRAAEKRLRHMLFDGIDPSPSRPVLLPAEKAKHLAAVQRKNQQAPSDASVSIDHQSRSQEE